MARRTLPSNKITMTNDTLETSIQSLLADIEHRVADHILEPSNAALLKKLILKADDIDEANMIAALGTTYKRTGFHFDKRLENIDKEIHYFRKNEKLSFSTNSSLPVNKLIIGDNYLALQNLLIEYRGRINVIYIDPPYGKDSMGEFAKTNYENALSRDNLLSMLFPRLILAKQLLANDGVIFCSIDDKNQAYVKCLFDDVFGERNYITSMPKKGTGGRQDSKYFAIVHEYLLCYAKSIDNYTSGKEDKDSSYNLYDKAKKLRYKTQLLRKWGDNSRRENRPNLFYPIFYNEKTGKLSVDRDNVDDIKIFPMLDADNEGCWRWGKSTMQKAFDDGLVEVRKNRVNSYIPYERLYETPGEKETKLYTSWIDDVDNATGAKLLKTIIPDGLFSYPKAVDYVKKIVMMATDKKDAIILDFFAGSGTTGHAVLELNEQDSGTRQFILCQLNEKTDSTPQGIAYDVTTKRLKRIMTGECYDGSRNFKWAQDNLPYGGNLDVYEIEGVTNDNATENHTPFDVIDETLYGQDRFSTFREKVKWVCANFSHTQKYIENDEEWEQRQKEVDNATGE